MEVAQTDTAFESFTDLTDIVFKATERGDLALPNDCALSEEAHFRPTRDRAVLNVTTRNRTEFRHTEDFAHFSVTSDDFFILGLEHANHRLFDVFEQLVDDLVRSNLDVLLVGKFANLGGR